MADPTTAQLWAAGQVCDDCGRTWGSAPAFPEAITSWHGVCHICRLELGVSHVRHYGYLRRGLAIVEARSRGSAA